ncbi:MAG: hypothetical protein MJ252_14985 [archaeon]|nr:hypothetical protein [archaeon]
MHSLILFTLLFSALIQSNLSQQCQKISCSEINNPDTCSISVKGETKLQLCSSDKFCSFTMKNYLDQGKCSSSKNDEYKKYPGMDCEKDSDCMRNSCVQKKCKAVGKGEECKTAFECDYGLTCIDKKCNTPKTEGQSCIVDYDCALNLGCLDGKCTKYFSLLDGSQTGFVNVHQKGLSLCRSGYASEFGECQSLKLQKSTEPCDDNNPCIYLNGTEKLIEPENCLCGLNSKGNKYCKLGSGDYKYKIYIQNLKDYYFNENNCHITERGESACLKDILTTNETMKNKVLNLEKSKIEALYYNQFYSSDQCIKNIMYPDIYKSDTFNKCGAYQCIKENNKNCAESIIEGDNLKINLYTTCTSDEYCNINNPNIFFYQKENKYSKCSSNLNLFTKYPGEECSFDSECLSIKSNNQAFGQCIKNKCFGYGIGHSCASSLECSAGLYCDNSICVEQKKIDEDCKKTEDCKNNLLCYKGKCQDKIYTFNPGQDVEELENPQIYCKLGTVLNNKCVEVHEENYKSEPKECTIGSDCLYKTNNNEDFIRKCGCGFNSEGKGYCPKMHDHKKDKWNEYFNLKKESFNNNCHTLNRYKCENKNSQKIKNLEIELINEHLYYKSVDCAKEVIGGFKEVNAVNNIKMKYGLIFLILSVLLI